MPDWRNNRWGQPQQPAAAPGAPGGVPAYDAEVNKGSINMQSLVGKLNARARDGWRLHTMLEQHSNTIIVYERWR